MTRLVALRVAAWLVPLVLVYLLVALRRPSKRLVAGILLASAWNLSAVLALNIVAGELGWWSFAAGLPEFMGVAVEPWIGWVILWGAAVPLAGHDRPVVVSMLLFLWVDLIAMPLLEPLLILGDDWLIGEGAALVITLVPGILLARWTATDTHLYRRASLQVLCAGALMLWLIPSVAMETTGGWGRALDVPLWQLTLALQVLAIPLGLGVRAVMEFATRGGGTPLPYDPPKRLVVGGPYAYVANPMQLSMTLLFVLSGVVLRNVWIGAAALGALAYSAGLAAWHEGTELEVRFGDDWRRYRAAVRPWVPRLRPHVPEPSTLLVAYSCGICSSIGRWFAAHRPIGLTIAPAEESPDPGLLRVTYRPGDGGPPARGVAGIARALEHIHLGWALVGWLLALPGVVHLAQTIVDVWGPLPQRVRGRAYDPSACDVEV